MATHPLHAAPSLAKFCAATGFALLAACGGGGDSADPLPPVVPPSPPAPTVGTIRFEVQTTGAALDVDGYTLALDAAVAAPIAATSNTTFADVAVGSHRLVLTNLDCNCATTSPNPATVDVTGGNTSIVHVDIACPAKSAQPQPVDLRSSALFPFSLVRYRNQLVAAGSVNDTALRAGTLAIGLLNFDSTIPLDTEVLPVVADHRTTGGYVLASDFDVRVLSAYSATCSGCNLRPGLEYSQFNSPFSSAPTQITVDFMPPGGSTDSRTPLAISGSLALYQSGRDGNRDTFASRYNGLGARETIVPLSTSRGRISMSLAASSQTNLSTVTEVFPPASVTTQPLTADGLTTGAPVTLETDVPTIVAPVGASIAWCQDRFAAVWWAQHSYVDGHVFVRLRGRTLDANGVPLAGAVDLTAPLDFTTEQEVKPISLSCLDNSGFLLAYVDAIPSITLVATDLELTQTGTRNFATLTGVALQSGPHVVYDSKQFGVAWLSKNSDAFWFSRSCRAP